MKIIKRNRWVWLSVIGAMLCSATVTGCMGGQDDDDDARPGVVGGRDRDDDDD